MNHYITSPIDGDKVGSVFHVDSLVSLFFDYSPPAKPLSHENGAKADRAHNCLNITGFVLNME